jgi:hypothetical protein
MIHAAKKRKNVLTSYERKFKKKMTIEITNVKQRKRF